MRVITGALPSFVTPVWSQMMKKKSAVSNGNDDDEETTTKTDKKMPKDREPCILLMDSLLNRQKAVYKFREYLDQEWTTKKVQPSKGMVKKKVFDRTTLPVYKCDVPAQDNFSDCGVFLLHYAETFCRMPDVSMIKKDWFPIAEVSAKREEIKGVITRLREEQRSKGGSDEEEGEGAGEEGQSLNSAASDVIMSTAPFSQNDIIVVKKKHTSPEEEDDEKSEEEGGKEEEEQQQGQLEEGEIRETKKGAKGKQKEKRTATRKDKDMEKERNIQKEKDSGKEQKAREGTRTDKRVKSMYFNIFSHKVAINDDLDAIFE